MKSSVTMRYNFVLRQSDADFEKKARSELASGITPVEDEDIRVELNEITDTHWKLNLSFAQDGKCFPEVYMVYGRFVRVDVTYKTGCFMDYSTRKTTMTFEIPGIADNNEVTVIMTDSGIMKIRSLVLNPYLRQRIRCSTDVTAEHQHINYKLY